MTYINDMRNNEYVREKQLANGICSYNYTNKAFFQGVWDNQTVHARGLFCRGDQVVARSYDKFFAVGERPETQEDVLFSNLEYPVNVFRKENGYLGIVSYDPEVDDLFIASKSTNEGDFANRLREILYSGAYDVDTLKCILKIDNVSAVFEVIDPDFDPHIVEYHNPQLVLLDLIYNDFEYSHEVYHYIIQVAKAVGVKCKLWMKTIYDEKEMRQFYQQMKSTKNMEGFVCEDAGGYMFKVKTNWYKYWKRMRSVRDAIYHKKTRSQIWQRYRLNENDTEVYDMMEEIVPIYYAITEQLPSMIFLRKKYELRQSVKEYMSGQ